MEKAFMRNSSQLCGSLLLSILPLSLGWGISFVLNDMFDHETQSFVFRLFSYLVYVPEIIIFIHLMLRALWSADRFVVDSDGVRILRFGSVRQSFCWDSIREYGIVRLEGAGISHECMDLYFSLKELNIEERINIGGQASFWYLPIPRNSVNVIQLNCVSRKGLQPVLNQVLLSMIPSSILQGYSIEQQLQVYSCLYTNDGRTINRINKNTMKELTRQLGKQTNRIVYLMCSLIVCSFIFVFLLSSIM